MNLCPLVWNVKSPPTLKEINEMINKGFVSVGKQNLPLVTSVCTCWFFFFFLRHLYAPCGAQTHHPEIKCGKLY